MKNKPPAKSIRQTYFSKAICIILIALFSSQAFSQPCTPPIVDAPTVTQPTCAVPIGSIIVFASGVSTLEYSLNGTTWQTSNTFSGLVSGNYTITVRLQANPACTSVFIGNPVIINALPVPPIVNAPTVTQPDCVVSTGTIVVHATGVGTLEYSIDGIAWQVSNTFSGLAPGNYTVSARLQTNPTCLTAYSGNPVIINAVPVAPAVNAPTVTQPTCAVPSGTIVINATGGGVLEYSIDGTTWQASNTFSGLASGNYTISVRLQSSTTCVTAYSANPVVINAVPLAPIINTVAVTQPTCAVTSGTIVINATGSGTLEYSIDGGTTWQISNTFSGLAQGTYSVSVRLQSSPTCVTAYSSNPVFINAVPIAPTMSAPAVTQPTCAIPTGTIGINATGSGVLEYSIDGGTTWQAFNTFSSLAPGNYTISVRLQTQPTCVTAYSGNPVVINAVPALPTVNAPTVTQPTCAIPTGTIVVNATGSGVLEYSINGTTWQASNTFSGLAAGNYTVSVRLQSSPTCVTAYSGNPVVINVVPALPTVNAPTVTQPTCAIPTGTIVINATGSGSLEYSIDGTTWQASNIFSGLAPGNYTLSVRLQTSPTCVTAYSGNPVVIDAVPVPPTVNAPTVTQPTCAVPTGTIVLNATGSGTLEYSIDGTTWQTSNTFSGLAPGNYTTSVRLQSSPTCVTAYSGNPVVINAVPTVPNVNAPTVTQPVCGTPTGTIVVNATGTGTLEYSIDGITWQASNTFSGLAPGNYTVSVRLQSSPSCVTNYSGNPVVINIAPVTPTVNTVGNQTLCTNTATTAVTFTGTPSGVVFNWTNNTTSIGLAASGSGNITSFTAINNSLAPVTATITVTPSFTNAGGTCTGTPITFTITVNPVPTITCPGDQTANITPGSCSAVVTYATSSTGTPAPAITYIFTGATTGSGSGDGSGSSFNTGTTVVTITATNACAVANCSFNVVITDNEPPVITCPGNIAVNNDAGICGAVVNYSLPVVTDNCTLSVGSLIQTAGLANGAVFPIGTTINTFKVTDAAGNIATCSFTVVVTDNEKPVITCPADIEQCNNHIVTFATPAATDNCSATVTASAASGSTFPTGTTVVTLTATDPSGNTSTCTFNVTISVQPIVDPITDQSICDGATTTFTVTATGALAPTYQWQIDQGSGFVDIADIAPFSGATTATLTITGVTTAYNGNNIRVVVTNTCGSTNSNAAVLTVKTLPTITVTPDGSCAPVALTAQGADTYSWSPATGLSATTGSTVTASPEVNTVYTVTGSVTATGCQNSSTVSVLGHSSASVLSGTTGICPGGTANLQVNITGGISPYTVVFSDGTSDFTVTGYTSGDNIPVLPSANTVYTLVSVTGANGCAGGGNSGTAVITINPVPVISAGPDNQCGPVDLSATGNSTTYAWSPAAGLNATTGASVTANPAVNTVYTVTGTIAATGCQNTVTVTVNYTPVAPVITPSAVNLCSGFVATLTSSAGPTPAVWSPVAGLYTDPAATIPYVAGTQVDTVYAKPVTTTTYSVTTSTATCTSLPGSVTVTVLQPISITTQPADLTVCQGTNASFTIVTPGAALPSGNFQMYQWQVKIGAAAFANIANANSATLTFPAGSTALSGNQYQVIITNGCFTVTSNAATLTVNESPVVTVGALPYKICLSDSLIQLSGTPAGGSWSGIGVSGSNFIPSATALGTYTLTYSSTNDLGCTTIDTLIAKVEDCHERIILLRDSAVILWPNPNNGHFFIRINSVLYNYLGMRVYTSAGQLVKIQNFSGLSYGQVVPIDLSKFASAVYMVEFYYDDGIRTSQKTFKVVVMSH